MDNFQWARMQALTRFSIVAALLIFLASCALAKQDKLPGWKTAIIGKWKEIDGPTTIQFFDSGTVILAGKKKTMTAYYKVLDEEHLRIEPKFSAKVSEDPAKIVKFSIVRDQLTINDLLQKPTRFQKQN